MLPNKTILDKINKFASKLISLSEFQDLLESSSRGNPIRVAWETKDGTQDYYWMWWENGPLGTTPSGEKMSNTKSDEGMYNIQTFEKGKWRTLDLQTVSKCRFENKLYIIK
jgi:hypothetical protein